MKFQSLRLKTKIAATALIPIFLFLILATVGLLCLNEVVNMINSVDDSYRTVSQIMKVQNTSRELKSAMDSYLLSRRDEFPAQIKSDGKGMFQRL